MENWTVKSVDGVDVNATPEVQAEQTTEAAPTAQEQEQAIVEEATAENDNIQIEDDGVIRVNLDKPPKQKEDEQQVSNESEEPVEAVAETETSEESSSPLEIVNEAETEEVKEETPVVNEVVEQEPVATVELPENIQKLVDFMDETGGSLEDYVKLNRDLDNMDDTDLVKEYYKSKYPHYTEERLKRRMDKDFAFDAEMDDPDVIQDKKDAFEDAVFDAKRELKGMKEKFYDELKFNRKQEIPKEYQDAYELATNYTQAEKTNKQLHETFVNKTNEVFNQDFKGFDFKLGDNTYRYKVADVEKTKSYQSDINNFIGEFLDDNGAISDAQGYHKAMFAAKNVDKIAQHFYEQGKADAIKSSAKEAKNISMDPRQDMSANVTTKGGTKVRVVSNEGFSGKLKFKNYNNR